MRKRRKEKSNYYILIAVLCLVILFSGYSYVYKLAEKRKINQEVATISVDYEINDQSEKYNELFIKLMSRFNIFFKETYKKLKEEDKLYEDSDTSINTIFDLLDNNKNTLNFLQIIKDKDYDNKTLYETKVYLANNKKEDFFTVNNSNEIISRNDSIRNININYEVINDKTNIVIFHTHATESYIPESINYYHSQNEEYNVMGIGKRLSENLSKFGLNVKHITAYNDLPTYSQSYLKSCKAVEAEIKQDKKNLLIDVHRDAADKNTSYEKFLKGVTKTTIKNKTVATFSLVIGGSNENIDKLKEIAKIVKNNSDKLYPGLCRDIVIRPNSYFNQDLSDYSLLIEIGSNYNTIEEAQYTCDMISEVLCETIIEINN